LKQSLDCLFLGIFKCTDVNIILMSYGLMPDKLLIHVWKISNKQFLSSLLYNGICLIIL
jgi:hypothetical protein